MRRVWGGAPQRVQGSALAFPSRVSLEVGRFYARPSSLGSDATLSRGPDIGDRDAPRAPAEPDPNDIMRFAMPPNPTTIGALSLLLGLAGCAGAGNSHKIPRAFLPPLIILHEPTPNVPEAARQYLGVWEFDGIFPGHSHPYRNIIAVTRVDPSGAVCLRQLSNTPITFNGPRWFSNVKQGQIDAHGIRFDAGIADEWLVPVDSAGPALAAYLGKKAPPEQRSFNGTTLFDIYHRIDMPDNSSLLLQHQPQTETPLPGAACAD
jgi:hypothetical protein